MATYKRNKLIFGVGINDVDYNVYSYEYVDGKEKVVWSCPFYVKWKSMLERCYYSKLYVPNYLDCEVCDDWLKLSLFKKWMETQDWEGKQLDKDLLVTGNRIYSPETCVFVERRVNSFLTESNAARGEYPIGVSWHKRWKKFAANCRSVITNKAVCLGYFKTPEEAHLAWLSFKLEQAHILASEQSDVRVAKALIDRYTNYGKEYAMVADELKEQRKQELVKELEALEGN